MNSNRPVHIRGHLPYDKWTHSGQNLTIIIFILIKGMYVTIISNCAVSNWSMTRQLSLAPPQSSTHSATHCNPTVLFRVAKAPIGYHTAKSASPTIIMKKNTKIK